MQASVDVNALIIDPGSSTVKAGFAGNDSPSVFFDSSVGYIDPHHTPLREGIGSGQIEQNNYITKPLYQYYDNQLGVFQPQKLIQNTIQNGLICDFEKFEDLLASIYTRMSIIPSQHPVLFAEPLYNTKSRREKLTEITFETFHHPQYTQVNDVVLDCFSVGKPAGLVVNMGSGKTTIAAVVDGHAIYNGAVVTKVAGDSIDALLSSLLKTTHQISQLPLDFEFEKKLNTKSGKIEIEKKNFNPSISSYSGINSLNNTNCSPVLYGSYGGTPSYRNYMERKLLRDIKHTCLRIPFTPYNPEAGAKVDCFYTLPDGNIINVGEIGCILGESFFSSIYGLGSEIITDYEANNQHNKSTSYTSSTSTNTTTAAAFGNLPLLIHSTIIDSDVDIRTMLLNNIVLTGGNSILSGLPQRLQIELSSLFTAGFSTHITKQLTQFERVFGTWIGGSICASLSSFLPRFIFRSEYEEFGMNILSRKML